jgi:phage-related protein
MEPKEILKVFVRCVYLGYSLFVTSLTTLWLFIDVGEWFVGLLALAGWLEWAFFSLLVGLLLVSALAAGLIVGVLVIVVGTTVG